ncbi:MAG: hypothetical protein U5L06_14610 [Rhodovibrio sp.]|nr:hypothetical protein [Rhodovibrio sp.]
MTERLETVIEKLRQLPETDQDTIAAHLDDAIDALRSDRKWEHLLANSPETLAALAEEARAAEVVPSAESHDLPPTDCANKN